MTRTLTLHQVHSDYQGQKVLKGLSLDLAQGEILALLGPSGCGKTTLLRAVAGLQAISQGEILINGKLVSGQKTFVPSEQLWHWYDFPRLCTFSAFDRSRKYLIRCT